MIGRSAACSSLVIGNRKNKVAIRRRTVCVHDAGAEGSEQRGCIDWLAVSLLNDVVTTVEISITCNSRIIVNHALLKVWKDVAI